MHDPAAPGALSESELYASYFKEADAAVLSMSTDKTLVALQKKAVGAAGLLTAEGEAQRWFAVPGESSATSKYVDVGSFDCWLVCTH